MLSVDSATATAGTDWSTVGAWVSAVVATATLLLSAWTRYLDQLLARTRVTAWAIRLDDLDGDLSLRGARVWVRNGTAVALQGAQVVVWPRHLRPNPRTPGGPVWGIASTGVPFVVPPHETVEFVVPGPKFYAWKGHSDPVLVTEVIFQDALGKWWHRTPRGLVQPFGASTKYGDLPPNLGDRGGKLPRWLLAPRFRHPG